MPIPPGTKLGPYEIVARLGSGGMGIVYRATDPRLKRTVAIKLLPPERTSDAMAKQRLIQEAQAASALDHPNICTIYEINESEGGQLYLVMACYDGETLRERIKRGRLEPESAIALAAQVGEGLARAHAAGIVHRDIKPDNVMVTSDGTAKILDFGLARPADAQTLTQAGMAVGTVAYMSPEQAAGHKVDHRTDIWSLGVLLYEMLSGKRPFGGANPFAIARSIERDRPLPVDNELLQRIVGRALTKDREARYATVRALIDDLRQTHGTPAATTMGLALKEDVPSIAVLPFTNTSVDPDNESFADGLAEEIINTLGRIDGLRVAARGSSFFFKGHRVDLRDVGQRLQVGTVLEGSVRKAGLRLRITAELVSTTDGYQLWSERYDGRLEDIFGLQDEIAANIAEKLKVTLAHKASRPLAGRGTRNVEAYEAYLKGRALLYKRGRFIVDAITYFEQAVALDPEYALPWAGLADGRTALGSYGLTAPSETLALAKSAALKAVELDGSIAETRCALAMTALVHDFDVATARTEFVRAMQINARYSQSVCWYAFWVLCFVDGRFDEAVELMQPAVESNPLSGYDRRVLAAALAFSGRHTEAITESLASIDLAPESFMPFWTLVVSYALAGRHAEAIATGHAALAMSGRHPFVMVGLAAAYADSGKRVEAQKLYDELAKRAESQWISPALWASVAASAELADKAVELVARAIAERDPHLLSMIGAFPLTEGLRRVLADAGRLDDFRRRSGLLRESV